MFDRRSFPSSFAGMATLGSVPFPVEAEKNPHPRRAAVEGSFMDAVLFAQKRYPPVSGRMRRIPRHPPGPAEIPTQPISVRLHYL
jgi:hypothetical protein